MFVNRLDYQKSKFIYLHKSYNATKILILVLSRIKKILELYKFTHFINEFIEIISNTIFNLLL